MKSLKKLLILLAVVAVAPHTAVSQELLTFSVDVAKFKADETKTYVEIYVSVPREYLRHVQEAERYVSKFDINVTISDGDVEFFNKSHNKTAYAKNLDEIQSGQKLLSTINLYMKEGNFTLKVRVTDLLTQKSVEKELNLAINPVDFSTFSLSDLELASSIKESTVANEFYKNGYTVIPNPNRIFGSEIALLYFYIELYNLEYREDAEDMTYEVSYKIVDNEGSIVKSYPPKTRKKPGSSSVEVGGINTTGFDDGQYYLNVSIRDNNTGEQIDKVKEFYVFKSITTKDKNFRRVYSLQERIAFEEEQINDLNDQEIADLFDNMKLILTNEDKNAFKMYRFPEKKRFIAVFWANNDPILGTLANELKTDYFTKINYSNEKFRENRPGWKTDRGKIYITVGNPDYVEYFPNTPGKLPYQIWYYYRISLEGTEGGIQYIFADLRKSGNYVMIHSTDVREIHNPDWQDLITRK